MIKNKTEYIDYLKADLTVNEVENWKWKYRISRPTIHFQRLLRKVEYYKNCRNDPLGKIYLTFLMYIFKRKSLNLGLTIPINTFGPGLSIAHYGSIVVNSNTKIGKNCRIHSSTNIGGTNKKVPIIGNNAYIGPGAKIFGDISIGNNVAIGANAVVNKDIPSNVTVAGAPAKIISNKGSKGLIKLSNY